MQLPEAEPAARKGLLDEHVKAIQAHVKQLSEKDYPGKLGKSIEFVVMFIPLESMLSDAFQHRPGLLKESLDKKVLLATPITLLALLTAVKKGWDAVDIDENLDQIRERLSLIYGRFIPLINHFNDLGKELGQATGKYNEVLKSIEGSVMVGLDEIKELGLTSKTGNSHSSLMSVDEESSELAEKKIREYADQLDVGDDLQGSND
jgi:DNA recombination protein RmuC